MPYKDKEKDRECRRRLRLNDPEKYRKRNKEWRDKNPDKVKKYATDWRKQDKAKEYYREYHKEYDKQYTMIHSEEKKRYDKKYRDSEKGKAWKKKYYRTEQCQKTTAEYNKKNKEKIKERDRICGLKRRHNVTLQQYDEMLEKQNGCCAICGIHHSKLKKSLSVDHNHTSGEIRELLCNGCNLAIGNVYENIDTLENIIIYLKKHKFE